MKERDDTVPAILQGELDQRGAGERDAEPNHRIDDGNHSTTPGAYSMSVPRDTVDEESEFSGSGWWRTGASLTYRLILVYRPPKLVT